MMPEHFPHCRACKERVGELLTAIYGSCQVNASFSWSAKPEDYGDTRIGEALRRIRTALGELRGHRDFIKSALVPPCDFHISNPPFILEFDESQHFSRPRLMTLSLYPEEVKLGFALHRWEDLCREIDAKDDEPVDRDERRAWYDTLRDLVPTLHGFKPTVRLYASGFIWCSLDATSKRNRQTFLAILSGRRATRIKKK
jgi:hypothetical protein